MPAESAPQPGSFVDVVRGLRNKEQWVRYDSILIGPGAKDQDNGWFNNWSEFAAANQIQLFSGARQNAPEAFCNTSEREDWAQLVYGMYCEFFAPGPDLRQETISFDFDFARWWTTEVPRSTYLTVQLNDTDNILRIPANYAPAGHGTTEQRVDGAAAPTQTSGTSGIASVRECFQWPIPIGVPATKRIKVQLSFDKRIFDALVGLTNAPGSTLFATPDPANPMNQIIRSIPNRFGVRVGLIGPRFAQLRGAYSQAAGAD